MSFAVVARPFPEHLMKLLLPSSARTSLDWVKALLHFAIFSAICNCFLELFGVKFKIMTVGKNKRKKLCACDVRESV